MKVVFEILFLIFFNENISFVEKKLIRKSYIAIKALLTTQKVELIGQKIFLTLALHFIKMTLEIYIAVIKKANGNIKLLFAPSPDCLFIN